MDTSRFTWLVDRAAEAAASQCLLALHVALAVLLYSMIRWCLERNHVEKWTARLTLWASLALYTSEVVRLLYDAGHSVMKTVA